MTIRQSIYVNGFDVKLRNLPSSLKRLCLQCNLIDLELNNIPPNVEHIEVDTKFIPLGIMQSKTLKSLKIGFDKPVEKGSFPPLLEHLDLGYDFNQSLNGSLPETLLSIRFSVRYDQPLAGQLPPLTEHVFFPITGVFSQELKKGDIPDGCKYLHLPSTWSIQLNRDTFPQSLTHLYLPRNYNEPIDVDVLPKNLKILDLGDYNHTLAIGTLPQSLTELSAKGYNKPLERGHLPNSIRKLSFSSFNCRITGPNYLPNQLENLNFGREFQKPVHSVHFPKTLKTLKFGVYFNQNIRLKDTNITHLIFTDFFDKPIAGHLPSTLEHLTLSDQFYQPLKVDSFSNCTKLRYLLLGTYNNHPIPDNTFPHSLETIIFGWHFNQSLKGKLPPNLEVLELGHFYNKRIEKQTLPPSLKVLRFKVNTKTEEKHSLIDDGALPEGCKIQIKSQS
ncbi:hypothetical protein DLAC_06524 [Tieghemostelium lacteum]|uniref:FNIP repeat-containing protein n=1 Tax=Tieghemostelium lacteum TaxID=361077 RepID=A0A151ZEY6_TIELA|nr:hypothetical protein DLAC_06524 [Tieghemostelium lacteum]|eukprot:KYQ92532.1 hypothetical protein DLAC_06524 [Tieghemostelium lacteum]